MNERKVIRIEATPAFIPSNADALPKKKRVCAYARVSTDSTDQLNSYNAQITEYTNRIQENKDWDFVDLYADEGTSGTSIKKRKNFLRMIEDARNGKIDLILTKSLSRFARNTVDCLSIIQELRLLNVEVFFEKENLRSTDSKVDLMLTIFSSIAQEEARNISENVKWGIRKRYKEGTIRINTSRFLGYDKDEHGKIIINESEAKVVRMIYNLYISGMSYREIAKHLIENGFKNGRKEIVWHPANIMNILKNEKYMGDVLLQKRVTLDYLSHKSVINTGQAPQYYIENNHDAIISKELFEVVQQTIKNRSTVNGKSRYGNQFPLSGIVHCSSCGRVLNRNYYNYRTVNERVVLTCKNTSKERIKCKSLPIDNETLEMVCSDALLKLDIINPSFIEKVSQTVANSFDSSHIIDSIDLKQREISGVEDEIKGLISLRISDASNQNDKYLVKAFENKKQEIEDLQHELDTLQSQLASLHINKERTLKLNEFLSKTHILSRDALLLVFKKIIQISNQEVILCMSNIEISSKDFTNKIELLKKYDSVFDSSIKNKKNGFQIKYRIIEIGDELI
jgi:site-specific DNA recombinase